MSDIALLCGRVLLMLTFLMLGINGLQVWPSEHLHIATRLGVPGMASAVAFLAVYLLVPVLIMLGWRARLLAMLLVAVTLIDWFAGGRDWALAQRLGLLGTLLSLAPSLGGLLLLVGAGSGRYALRPD